ncbi:GNAT family N-acetyltransferase [Arvimicrobium flavum]|uniref:GNAT family N-acetyltransferase n=1 Tax=Arvimicrobium flavum TaxID=3393320 RepID=UPI00237B30F2|nr:GNAT family N-acetyltransferase [Mesorhizobium shangrilense]
MTIPHVTIRPLTHADVPAFRALRLSALAASPDAFTASVEDEQALSEAEMGARAVPELPGVVFGAFAGKELVGMAGYIANKRPKTRHNATMVAVYVAPEWRKAKLGRRLVEAVIDHAATQRVILRCSVRAGNAPARRLYHELGFVPYGLERDAVLIDGAYHDDELLALDLRQGIRRREET